MLDTVALATCGSTVTTAFLTSRKLCEVIIVLLHSKYLEAPPECTTLNMNSICMKQIYLH